MFYCHFPSVVYFCIKRKSAHVDMKGDPIMAPRLTDVYGTVGQMNWAIIYIYNCLNIVPCYHPPNPPPPPLKKKEKILNKEINMKNKIIKYPSDQLFDFNHVHNYFI